MGPRQGPAGEGAPRGLAVARSLDSRGAAAASRLSVLVSECACLFLYMLLFTGFLFCVVGMVPCPSEGGVAGTVKVSSSPVCLLQVAGVVLSVRLPQRGPSAAARTRQGHPEGPVADVWGSLPAGVHRARPLRRPLRSAGGGPGSRSWCRGLSAPVHISCTPAGPLLAPAPEWQLDGVGEGRLTAWGRGQR